MSTTVLYAKLYGTIDGISTTTAFANTVDLGEFYVAGAKNVNRRPWFLFDLYSADLIKSGLKLDAGARIVQASLVLGASNAWHPVTAPFPPFAAHIYRLIRTDMDGVGTTWANYKTGTPWTSGGGGDVGQTFGEGVPFSTIPSGTNVAFSTPALGNLTQAVGMTLADQYIDVTQATQYGQRQAGGLVALIATMDNENPGNPNDTFQQYGGAGNPLQRPRLSVQVVKSQIAVV